MGDNHEFIAHTFFIGAFPKSHEGAPFMQSDQGEFFNALSYIVNFLKPGTNEPV